MTIPRLTGNEDSLRWDRLADAYDDGQLSDAEIRRTRARLEARAFARQRSKLGLVLVAGLQGFAIGLVTLGAGAWVTQKVWLSETRVTGSAPAEAQEAKAAPPAPSRPGKRPAAVAVAPAPAEPPAADFDDVPEAPPEVTPRGVTPRAPAPAANDLAASPASFAAVPQLEAPPEGPWKRVAGALATGDLSRADWELSGLAASSDPATRDAAELARAQLAISAGRGAATVPTLTRLASSGHTPLIRKRAAELLGVISGR